MSDPPPRAVEAPPPIECHGRVHRWSPMFAFGDTCECGAFYLFRDPETEGLSIEERDMED